MMTKIIYIFTIFLITIPAIADVVPNLNVATTSFVQGAMATKQDVIDSTHKLNADLVNDSSSTNKFVTATEKSNWNAKQGQLQNNAVTPANVSTTVKTSVTTTPASASDTNLVTEKAVSTALSNKQDTIDTSHKLSADLVDDTSTTNKFVTASEKSTWNAKQNQLTNGTSNVSNTVSTTVRATGTANDTTLVTEKAVRDAIAAGNSVNVTVDNTGVSTNNPVPFVSNVTSSNGTITVTRNDLAVPVKSNGVFNNTSVPIWFE